MRPASGPNPPEHPAHLLHPSIRRLAARNLLVAAALIMGSLAIGMVGFHVAGGYGAVESFSQAALLLAGEGPSGAYPNDASRIFAGMYALYSGLAYIVMTALLLAPVFTHVLKRHKFDVGDSKPRS